MTNEPTRELAILLHADVVGSTSLVRVNETLAHMRIRDIFRRFAETIARHDGNTHEIRGDALIAQFSRASDAVAAAVEFQIGNRECNTDLDGDVRPELRVGIAIGEVVIADNTVTGEGIVLAQRLEQLAAPNGVCIQGAAYETLPKRLPFLYENLGEKNLKGFMEPVRVYSIKTGNEGELPVGPSSGKTEAATLGLPSKPSIAVLPFDNMSHDSEQDFFADGISEDIITELSKFRNFLSLPETHLFPSRTSR